MGRFVPILIEEFGAFVNNPTEVAIIQELFEKIPSENEENIVVFGKSVTFNMVS
jgi:hypothetical protein